MSYKKFGAVGDGIPFIVHDPCLKQMCYINKQANSYFLFILDDWPTMDFNGQYLGAFKMRLSYISASS